MNRDAWRKALIGAAILGFAIVALRWLSPGDEEGSERGPASQFDVGRGIPEDAASDPASGELPGAKDLRPRGAADGSRADGNVPGSKPFSFSDFDEEQAPSRELIRTAIEVTIAERFTSYRLSSDELERATDALMELREAQEALRALPMGRETAEERRILVEQIGEATSSFNEVLDMDPADFTADAVPGVGIDRFDPDEAPPEPEFIERDR